MSPGKHAELIYVHDPMCSWCWGFEEIKNQLYRELPATITHRRLLGGLAKDSSQLMPRHLQQQIQQTWKRIEVTIPGIVFNFDFWSRCSPRRSTYPACRAVIAARQQGDEYDEIMTSRIQQAYYQEARNPSDASTLQALAAEIGLNLDKFQDDLAAEATQQILMNEIQLAEKLHIDSFPALLLKVADTAWPVAIDYLDASTMLEVIQMLLDDCTG